MSNFISPEVAVIPAAGKGTRFLPSTKATPKELHPLLNTPLLHHSLKELKEAGVKEVIIVNHPDKKGLNRYFESHSELKKHVSKNSDLVKALDSIDDLPKVTFVYQTEQKGLAHAISCAESVLNGRDFFVLLPDEIFFKDSKDKNPSEVLLESFKDSRNSCVSLLEVPKDKVSSYGVVKFNKKSSSNESDSLSKVEITDIIEKPKVSEAPSNLILPGRYLFKNKILECIRKTPLDKNGEVKLTDSMVLLSKEEPLIGIVTDCPRFDGGSVLGFLKANVFAALRDPKLSKDFESYLKNIL